MDADGVRIWVTEYERAWREQDSAAVAHLFGPDVHYLDSPYEEPRVGHTAIAADWNDPRPFTMTVDSVTVDGSHAVVRVTVHYAEPHQEYADLWELDFDTGGRVRRFVEWAYWPGRPFTPQG